MFTYPIEIAATPAGPFESFDAFVDTGAFYSQLPASVLRRLGVTPVDRVTFILADGRREQSDIGYVTMRIDGRERPTICVFAEEESSPLLGAYSLEAFLLGVDPVNKRLIPIEGVRL